MNRIHGMKIVGLSVVLWALCAPAVLGQSKKDAKKVELPHPFYWAVRDALRGDWDGEGGYVAQVTVAALGAISSSTNLTNNGTVNLNSSTATLSALSGSGTLKLGATTKVALSPHAAGAHAVAVVGTLTVPTGAQFDLSNNDLIDNYTGTSPAATIRGYLQSGFNAGAWNGNGLSSATAAANAAETTGLGYAEAADLGVSTFDGQSVTSAVIVKYTYYGDSNLDGVVNAADFSRFLDGLATGGTTWSQGDYTYDGKVDLGNDFNLFLINYLIQGGTLGELAGPINAEAQLSASQRAALLSVVPEPAALSLIALVAIVAGRRRPSGSRSR